MKSNETFRRHARVLLAGLVLGASLLNAAEDITTPAATTTSASGNQSPSDEIAQLRALLAAQQKQLESLQHAVEQQQKLIEKTADSTNALQTLRPNLGSVASITPVLPVPAAAMPAIPAYPAPRPQAAAAASGNPCEAGPDAATPAYLRLGNTCIVPVGFMDLTPFWRDKNAASSMGSNFGSIPYNNAVNGNISEYHYSMQNSRLGLRVDGDWKGAHFIGYNEFDFNGTSGSSSLAVSNGAIVPRLRLFWVDVRKDKIEFLAGQSWSMMTPNRTGISAVPGDLFYTQVIDINYVAGLTWTRQPGLRVLYHPNEKVTFGFSAEQADQYMGGSAGGSSAVLPAAYLALQGTQLDAGLNLGGCSNNTAATATAVSYSCSGQGYLGQPTVAPDLIAKVAFDPSSRLHFEVTGIESTFKVTNLTAPLTTKHGATGGGVEVNANAEVVKNLRVFTNNFWSDGDGRYIFGQAPDLIVRSDESLSLIHSGSTLDGIEAVIKNSLLYAYYGGIYIGRDVAYDANGTSLIGYGYHGSSNSQNRSINEITFGFNQTMWRNPRYGAINVMGQYEWLQRDPWYVAIGAPKATHDNTLYFDVRYTLPGSMPKF
jgi:TolA-binding protein